MLGHRFVFACAAITLASCATGTVPCRCGERGCDIVCPDGSIADGSIPFDARLPGDALVPGDGTLPLDARPDSFVPPIDAFVPPDAPPPDVPGCVDADRDGHPAASCGGLDCGDDDPMRHPGALERCQGVDDDCDTRIDEGSFTAWFIGAGSTAWRSYELDCESPAAPTSTIETVVDIESLGRAYFLTSSTYHVLDLLTRRWVGSGARSTIVPETAGAVLIAGYTTPAGHAGSSTTIETLYLASATTVWVYEIDISIPGSPALRFPPTIGDGVSNPVPWTPAAGLQTAYQDVTGNWAPDPRAVCTAATYTAGPYSAYFTADRALIDDAGSCFMRIADLAIASFGPFGYPDAPARASWRHLVYNAGIWAFAAPRR
jgi:hypothetical protein